MKTVYTIWYEPDNWNQINDEEHQKRHLGTFKTKIMAENFIASTLLRSTRLPDPVEDFPNHFSIWFHHTTKSYPISGTLQVYEKLCSDEAYELL